MSGLKKLVRRVVEAGEGMGKLGHRKGPAPAAAKGAEALAPGKSGSPQSWLHSRHGLEAEMAHDHAQIRREDGLFKLMATFREAKDVGQEIHVRAHVDANPRETAGRMITLARGAGKDVVLFAGSDERLRVHGGQTLESILAHLDKAFRR